MSIGFDLGRLKSTSTGLSYLMEFDHAAGANSYYVLNSVMFNFATRIFIYLVPNTNFSATVVPAYPSWSATISQAGHSATVSVNGGNLGMRVIVFVG